ncbi:MAG: RNB domain-containing ribonuclease [Deltaproteobacteria bacterium]|nr:RNB domain-containing ribonuclease [Deltaproteobacteria bacterium]
MQERKSKWSLLNESGQELELAPDRIHLVPGTMPKERATKEARTEFLKALSAEAAIRVEGLRLDDVWELLSQETREYSVEEIGEVLYPGLGTIEYLVTRRVLLTEQPYFKRKKSGFEPRPASTVDELRVQAQAEEKKRRERESLITAIIDAMRGQPHDFPPTIRLLEDLAALGSQAPLSKEGLAILEDVSTRLKKEWKGRTEERAFQVLLAAGYFNDDTDLNLIRARRPREFGEEILREAQVLSENFESGTHPDEAALTRQDLTALEIVTIDSEQTEDIDDGLSLEPVAGGYRLGIHIADVSSLIALDSPLFAETLRRASSIYAPDYTIPMCPKVVSAGTASLVAGENRNALTFFLTLDEQFQIVSRDVIQSRIRVRHRLDYNSVDKVLYGEDSPYSPDVKRLLERLWDVATAFERRRFERGAVQFARRELNAVVGPDRRITIEESSDDLPARKLVGEMMISANETMALFARENQLALLFRSQEPPEVNIAAESQRVVEGPAREFFMRGLMKRSVVSVRPLPHFGLGLEAYVQATSPIRRAADLIAQHQVAHFLRTGKALFTPEQMTEWHERLEPIIDEIFGVQRSRNRYWLQKYLLQESIGELEGVIVRVDGPRPLVEVALIAAIFSFVPSKPVNDGQRSRLGESVRLRIAENNPRKEVFHLAEAAQGDGSSSA